MSPTTIPDVTFHMRVRNEALGGPNPFEWKDVTSRDIFGGKRVVLFAVPGAFTPACSESHLPGYERHYDEFAKLGVDQVICVFAPLRFPRPWDIEEINKAAFVVRDNNGQTLAYVYFEDEPGRRSAANLLTCAARVATR